MSKVNRQTYDQITSSFALDATDRQSGIVSILSLTPASDGGTVLPMSRWRKGLTDRVEERSISCIKPRLWYISRIPVELYSVGM